MPGNFAGHEAHQGHCKSMPLAHSRQHSTDPQAQPPRCTQEATDGRSFEQVHIGSRRQGNTSAGGRRRGPATRSSKISWLFPLAGTSGGIVVVGPALVIMKFLHTGGNTSQTKRSSIACCSHSIDTQFTSARGSHLRRKNNKELELHTCQVPEPPPPPPDCCCPVPPP
jgi:hypothetical protein